MSFARPYDAVLFDLDGTLLETAPEIAAAINAALTELGLPAVDPALATRWIGHGVRETLRQAHEYVSPNADEARREADLDAGMDLFEWHYATHFAHRSRLFPQVVETLTALRGAGLRTALVSNKETRFVDLLLAEHPLNALLDLVICGDTLARKKPDALPVLHVLKCFGVRPERALLVGDSGIDAACARNAGIAVWLVSYGYNSGQPVSTANPDRVIECLSEVARACTAPEAIAPSAERPHAVPN